MPDAGLPENLAARAAALGHPIVCVQGLGAVGAAMATAVASTRDETGAPCFTVIGVERDVPRGRVIVETLNRGTFPIASDDAALAEATAEAVADGRLMATCDAAAYALADTIIVDVNFDVASTDEALHFGPFTAAIETVAAHMRDDALVIVESTVPPGTCIHIVAPTMNGGLARRGRPTDRFDLAHSFERVMPGPDYLESIIRYWRVYAGATERAADRCEAFLSRVIDVAAYPLTRVGSTTASETAKIVENSYRATTIAFMDEWGQFAEAVGIDMFEIADAIRKRPTHANIRVPGFGVGGYCLPKDTMFARLAAAQLFERPDIGFPVTSLAAAVNRDMPLASVAMLENALAGGLAGKRVLLLGVTYRDSVADTRDSPSATFLMAARARGATVDCQDPLARDWPEMDIRPAAEIPPAANYDAAVFAVKHKAYAELDLASWLNSATPALLDANNVLTAGQRVAARRAGCRVLSIGRGEALP